MLDQTLTIILAGGIGSRLKPLTIDRAKPAVPFGGKYRIIDFALTNCLHSGLRRILVLTQYKSHSLQKHLRDGWSIFNPELGEYITPVPPQMRQGERWYAGTADAIHQNLYLVERSGARYVMILSGDHIYRMDYAAMLDAHQQHGADATVACMEVGVEEARAFGVVSIDEDNRITEFMEKPQRPATIPGDSEHALASMGVYLFSTELLTETLHEDHQDRESSHDFGKDILPKLIQTHRVFAHRFGGAEGRVTPDRYWRDVGTLDAFYEANMDLLKPIPALDLYQQDWPIRSYAGQTPPARTVPGASGNEGIFINSIVAGGTVIAGGIVQHSILFPNVFVGDETQVEGSILFDGVRVGDGAQLKHCIVDKGVDIPPRESIGYDLERDRQRFTVSDKGVVVVPKGFRFR
jgi:glucose-1-phosphate adenylyltransferase